MPLRTVSPAADVVAMFAAANVYFAAAEFCTCNGRSVAATANDYLPLFVDSAGALGLALFQSTTVHSEASMQMSVCLC